MLLLELLLHCLFVCLFICYIQLNSQKRFFLDQKSGLLVGNELMTEVIMNCKKKSMIAAKNKIRLRLLEVWGDCGDFLVKNVTMAWCIKLIKVQVQCQSAKVMILLGTQLIV